MTNKQIEKIRGVLEDIYCEGVFHIKGFKRKRYITIDQALKQIIEIVEARDVKILFNKIRKQRGEK